MMPAQEPKTSIHTDISDTWLREEQFTGHIDKDAVHDYARSQKANGDLIFTYHNGGIRSCKLIKKIDADIDTSDVSEKERREFGL